MIRGPALLLNRAERVRQTLSLEEFQRRELLFRGVYRAESVRQLLRTSQRRERASGFVWPDDIMGPGPYSEQLWLELRNCTPKCER